MPRDGHLKTGLSDIRNPKVQMPAFRDLGFRLSYLALVDGPVLSSACEDTHGKEMAELLLGLEGDGETCQRGTGLRAPVREERNAAYVRPSCGAAVRPVGAVLRERLKRGLQGQDVKAVRTGPKLSRKFLRDAECPRKPRVHGSRAAT